MESFIVFLGSNKTIIIAAATTVAELITIGVNLYRKLKAEKKTVVLKSKQSFTKKLIWASNPVNLFRKP